MNIPSNVDIETVVKDRTAIAHALKRGAQEVLRRHKLLGQSVAVWRDGKATLIPPELIRLDAETETSPKP